VFDENSQALGATAHVAADWSDGAVVQIFPEGEQGGLEEK
jgi:hypothetical protein